MISNVLGVLEVHAQRVLAESEYAGLGLTLITFDVEKNLDRLTYFDQEIDRVAAFELFPLFN